VVDNSGALRGLYVNHLQRSIADADGRLVARQLEQVRFSPSGTGAFQDGLTCRAVT
jgi:hypothetical protein